MKFARRRLVNTLILAVSSGLVYILFEIISLSLQTQQFYSGWLVFCLIVALFLYYIKKKFSILPIGSTASWAQWHYYLGLFLIVAFLIHIEFSIPDGLVETWLAGLLLTVIIVGIVGGLINRSVARRLAYLDEEIMFERIPDLRRQLKERLEEDLLTSVETSKSSTLSTYYVENLADYFAESRDILPHLLGSPQPHIRRSRQLEQQIRYLNNEEASFAVKLGKYLEQKNTLDAHLASQALLKYWGVLHAPIAVVMLAMTFIHIVLVYAFRGGA